MIADEPLKVGERVRVVKSDEAGHEVCIGKAGTVADGNILGTIHVDLDDGAGHYGPASDFERVDPEPMPEPTVIVPVALIEDLLEHTLNDRARAELEGLLPKPAPHRLRVVDLDALHASVTNEDGELDEASSDEWDLFRHDLEAAPDVMMIVKQAIVREAAEDRAFTADVPHMVACIRAALEEAVDRG